MPRTEHKHHIEVMCLNRTIHVRIDKIDSWARTPVTKNHESGEDVQELTAVFSLSRLRGRVGEGEPQVA